MYFNAKLTSELTDNIYRPKVINAFNLLESISTKLEQTTVLYLTEPEIDLLYQIVENIRGQIENEIDSYNLEKNNHNQ